MAGATRVPMPLVGSTELRALGLKVGPAEETIGFAGRYPPPG